jgi:AraC family transcriptional regulator
LTWEKLEAGLMLAGTPLEPLMLRLGREAMAPGLASETLIDALGTAVIIELARLLEGTDEPQRKGRLSTAQLAAIRERAASLNEPAPSLAELARLCGMSERNLLRLFKLTTGESVAAFVRNIRCDRAREMLAQTDFPLKEIAYRLGFASHSSFTAAFRRETGLNPTDFRRDHAIRRALRH